MAPVLACHVNASVTRAHWITWSGAAALPEWYARRQEIRATVVPTKVHAVAVSEK